jgi:class 3 adenylate cyclase/tetratricopeptide (TPR) repeat protein
MRCPGCGNENRDGARFCDSCGEELQVAAETTPKAEPVASTAQHGNGDGNGDLPSELVGGRYRVERFLGRGGRKRVYLARDTESDRDVAVAVFETEGVEETILARARREAQAMGRLGDHPHIVAVEESGEDDGRPYLVSPFLSGGDVEGLLDSAPGRRLEIDQAVRIAADVLRALEHAHALGIVHRDIKPANVWLDADGSARLGDFGLAATDSRSRKAVEGMLVGTVAYLPPEQALGRASDARSDLYSLGGLLYEMFTGQPPFEGDDVVAIISQHLNSEPVAPSRHRRETSQALDDFVLRLLAKAPDDRPESAAAARAELEAAAAAADEPDGDEEDNPLDRLAGGVFVGRERELDEMREGLEEALTGRGHLTLLVGEPGIGKTRTAEELATYAQVRGARVHWGRCHEGEGAPAYWPWAQALRSFVRDADPVGLAWELGPSAPEVAQLVPEVRDILGGVSEPPELEPDQARFRLFDSITTFLRNASGSRPLVIVLDDLHWADEASLLLLKFVARNLADVGLLIVGTYRDVELGRHHPLARTLAELSEIEQTRRVTLRGLDYGAIERFIEMTAGIEPPPGLASAVHEQTEGNPFFLGEVVRLLASEQRLDPDGRGDWELAIPQGVREVVGRRLDRLSEESNQVLAQAAAMGREFDVEVLAGVADCDRDMVERALAEAVEAKVLAEMPRAPGRFIFSHALVRETLYAEIPAARRIQLHGDIGTALERRYGDDVDSHLSEIAHHLLEAAPGGDVDRALEYAERAASSASRQLAHEEAVKHLERALEASDSGPGAERGRRLRLLLALGEARTKAGRFAAARDTLDEAADLAGELADDDAFVAATLGMVTVAEAGGVDERVLTLVQRSLEKVGDRDSRERSLLLTGLAQELYWKDPTGEAKAALDEAIEVARRVGDEPVLAAALSRRQFDLTANAQERLEMATELLEIAERAGADEMVVRSHAYRLNNLLVLGDIDGVDRELDIYTRLAQKLRQPQHLWHIPLLRGMRANMDGRFEEAAELASEALAGGQRAEEPLSSQFYAIQMSVQHTLRGTVDEMIPAVRDLSKRYPAITAWRLALVSFLCESGRLDEGREEFERLAALDFRDLPPDAQWITGVALISRAAWRLGDSARAERLYSMLAPYEGITVVAGRAAACSGPVSLYLGQLAMTMSRTADAIRHFEGAIEMSSSMGDRPFLAQARIGLAEALLARDAAGDRKRALELLSRVLEVGQELGMRPVVEGALALRLEAQGLGAIDVKTSIDTMISAVETERPDVRSFAAPDGTVTILFSDIEDSTLMAERLGDERWIEVLRAHNSVFRSHLRAHGGHEVKSQGDGFMLVFSDPRRAIECAAAIQRDLAEQEVGGGERISVRMGLHAGEAIREEGDFFGRSVILAARIAAQAGGGEILVSQDLREMVAPEEGEPNGDDGELAFDAGRELELKGLAGTHRVFRAHWEQQASPA